MFTSQRQDQEKDEYAKEREVMDNLDENGWAQVHHSAFHGFTKTIERFIGASADQLEFPTNDHIQMTPLLLAVANRKFETTCRLIELGADLRYVNHSNLGVVELAAQKDDLRMMKYFIEINHEHLPAWSRLIKFLVSDDDENAESAGKIVSKLTEPEGDKASQFLDALLEANAVPVLLKVIQSLVSDNAKYHAFSTLLNLITDEKVKEGIVKADGITTALKMLETKDRDILLAASTLLCHLASVDKYIDQLVAAGAIEAVIKLWQTCSDINVLIEATETLSFIATASAEYKQTIGTSAECFPSLVKLFLCHSDESLLLALSKLVTITVSQDEDNQNGFADEGGARALTQLANHANTNIQLSAINGIHMLAKDNPHTQERILDENGAEPLLSLLKRSSAPATHVCCAGALWALAGNEVERYRYMARGIGVNLLIDFLHAPESQDTLQFIGAEGLSVLARGPQNQQDAIAKANGVQPLVRLLRSPKKNIVLAAIRALRNLCIGIGYLPHVTNQKSVLSTRGIRYLVALMAHSKNELVKVESALSLGCCSVGNLEVVVDISQNEDFNYLHILRLIYSEEPLVQLLAGAALAAFSYNNIKQQQEIQESGGVRYHYLAPFLESSDEYFRCNAAFQAVVLARIIPDHEQASSSAEGIKLLIDILHRSKNDHILALTADCVARLAHTRAGADLGPVRDLGTILHLQWLLYTLQNYRNVCLVPASSVISVKRFEHSCEEALYECIPAAIISIGGIHVLCKLMLAENEQVSGAAAIALGYLSFNFMAERILLNKCRTDPRLYRLLRHYTSNYRLSDSFIEAYKHYKHIGLPPIDTSQRTSLVKQSVPFSRDLLDTDYNATAANIADSGVSPQDSSPAKPMVSISQDRLVPISSS